MKINPYLCFDGQCEEAFKAYAEILGGQIIHFMKNAGSPAEAHTAPEDLQKVLHVSLQIGDQVLMGSDAPSGYFEPAKGISISLNVDSAAEGERIYHALAEGGTVRMPYEQTFWAYRFAMLCDRFGTPWMINCERE